VSPRLDPGIFVQAWAESFSQVLSQIASTPVPCAAIAEAADLPSAAANDIWIVCTCSGALRGEMSFRIPVASAVRLAQRFMSEAEGSETEPAITETSITETPITQEHAEAVVEFLRQVAGLVASTIQPRWGEVQFRLDPAVGAPSWPASSTFWLRAGAENSPPLLLELQMSAALAAGLRAGQAEAAQPSPSLPAARVPEKNSSQLASLMDVELAMTLRFGSRRLPLREILEFCPGTVVELDRQVDEPVDLLLHGKLVARGEVVVVDGNYGLRVTEVVPAGN
ncbi:MAG: flagellar motor switch protein FliN, partial [Candidatus Sulfotelmatobacter sp.]